MTVSTDTQNTSKLCVRCNFTGILEESQCYVLVEQEESGKQDTLVVTKSQELAFGISCLKELPEGIYTVTVYDNASMTTPVFVYKNVTIIVTDTAYSSMPTTTSNQMHATLLPVTTGIRMGLAKFMHLI